MTKQTAVELRHSLHTVSEDTFGFSTSILPTGSVAFNGEGNDLDYLVFVDGRDAFTGLIKQLNELGYSCCSTDPQYEQANPGDWEAYRKGKINIMVIQSKEVFERWCLAHIVCKFLAQNSFEDGIDRFTRVAIHDLIRQRSSIKEAIAAGERAEDLHG